METSSWVVPVDIAACLEELGLAIEKDEGNEIYAKCPGHPSRVGKEDGHASWSINADTGIHYCFSCGFKGNFIALVHEVLGGSWDEATAWAKSRSNGIDRVRQILERPRKVPSKAVDTSENINEASLALFTDPPAESLSERLIDLWAAQRYGVKWNPAKGSWIMPIRDPENGKLWGWQEKNKRFFRNFPDEVPKSKTLFSVHLLNQDQPLILVESPLDAVRLLSVGYEGAVASFGASVSDAQIDLLIARSDTLIVAMDNDSAGRESARQLKRKLAGRMTVRFLNYEGIDVKDVGEMSNNEIHRAISGAIPSVVMKF